MALTESDPSSRAAPWPLWSRLKARLGGDLLLQRLAGTVFLIRVGAAMLAYGSQVLFARWMGGFEFGIYVYVWTWVLLLGSMMDFGISASAQKIIPEYRTRGEHALLRGFLAGSRWITFAVSSIVSLLLAGVVKGLSPWIDANAIVPLYIGCLTLPAFVVANTQDGIARSHDWTRAAGLRSHKGFSSSELVRRGSRTAARRQRLRTRRGEAGDIRMAVP